MWENFLKDLSTVFYNDHLISSARWEKGVSHDFGPKIKKLMNLCIRTCFDMEKSFQDFFIGFRFIFEKKHVD